MSKKDSNLIRIFRRFSFLFVVDLGLPSYSQWLFTNMSRLGAFELLSVRMSVLDSPLRHLP
jgi:hypothetical protein